jgi:electron transfer flavoprotein-quinone oxidoreductase
MLAAQTAIEAKQKGDFSKATLANYQKRLESSFIIPDMEEHKDVEIKVEKNMDLLTVYPELACRALHEYFTVDGRTKKEVQRSILRRALKARSGKNIIKDIWSMIRREDKKPSFWGLVKELWKMRNVFKKVA